MNQVILIGRLGKDPELTYTQSGTARCKFSLATSRRWRDKKDGSTKERTAWHSIVAWDALAKTCGQYLAKGRQVCIQGEIEYRDYEKDGVKRTFTEINASQVEFLGDGGQRERGSNAGTTGMTEPEHSGASAPDSTMPPDDDFCPF